MNRKGLITIFLIIGMIVIIGASLFIVVYREIIRSEEVIIEEQIISDVEVAPIKLFVNKCLEQSAKEALLNAGLKGMYSDSPDKARVVFMQKYSTYSGGDHPPVYFLIQTIPYYFYEGEFMIPTVDEIEEQYSEEVNDQMRVCMNSIDLFEELGYSIDLGRREIVARFAEGDVLVDMEYPIEVTIGDDSYRMDEFSTTIPFDFSKKYNMISLFMEEQRKYPDYYNYGKLIEIAAENGFEFESDNLEKDIIKVSMIFKEDRQVLGESFRYDFALKYNWLQ